jgi:4-carboxymuconolactone decarboxylase
MKVITAGMLAAGMLVLAGGMPLPAVAQGATAAPPAALATIAPPTPAQRLMGDVAPKLADLTGSVLFGDVWERRGLSKRDRSLVTVAALIAMNRPDQLRSHLARARENGVTQDELVEAITHLAFYAGWPGAVSAVGVAREVFQKKGRRAPATMDPAKLRADGSGWKRVGRGGVGSATGSQRTTPSVMPWRFHL